MQHFRANRSSFHTIRAAGRFAQQTALPAGTIRRDVTQKRMRKTSLSTLGSCLFSSFWTVSRGEMAAGGDVGASTNLCRTAKRMRDSTIRRKTNILLMKFMIDEVQATSGCESCDEESKIKVEYRQIFGEVKFNFKLLQLASSCKLQVQDFTLLATVEIWILSFFPRIQKE